MHAWHDDRRVERDRYAGLLAAGVTDAATLEASSAGVEIWRFSSLCETKEANLQTRNGRTGKCLTQATSLQFIEARFRYQPSD